MRGQDEDENRWTAEEEAPTRVSERRAAERSPIEVEVSLSSESQFFAGLSGDMSTGGLFVQTYEIRPVGSRVLVALSLPTGEIRAAGAVRWVRRATDGTPPGLGIAFERLTAGDRCAIEAFCDMRPALYHDLESD